MGRGGAEIQVKDQAIELARRGHSVDVVSLLPFEDFEGELRSGGVRTSTLGMTKGRGSARALAKLIRYIRQAAPEIVHAHMFSAIMATRLAGGVLGAGRALGRRGPVVIGTTHTPFETSRLRYLAYRLSDPLSDMWTCVSREGIDIHEQSGAVRRGNGLLTPNGVDVRRFAPDSAVRAAARHALGVKDETFVWLAVGSFRDEAKDYDTLLGSFAVAARGARSWRLVIAGSGALLESKKLLAQRLGIADRVDFLGLREDVAGLMQAADGFVMASAWEAMPMVLLEAAASALPSVVTDVGQNREIVLPQTGHVVPAKNIDALASAMSELAGKSSAERLAMGQKAREHVVRVYDLARIVDGWEERYRAMLDRA